MKLLQILLLITMTLSVITSCRKDNNATNTISEVAGVYEGKYGTGTNEPSSFYSFHLKADGSLNELNNSGAIVGNGTWAISGKTFTANYHYLSNTSAKFTLKAVYDAPEKTLIGTWGYDLSHNDGGIWYMTSK